MLHVNNVLIFLL